MPQTLSLCTLSVSIIAGILAWFLFIKKIYPYRQHTAIKSRRPVLLRICVFFTIFEMIFSQIQTLLVVFDVLDTDNSVYVILIEFFTYLGVPMWSLIRLWLVFWDLQRSRQQQSAILEQYLRFRNNNNSDGNNGETITKTLSLRVRDRVRQAGVKLLDFPKLGSNKYVSLFFSLFMFINWSIIAIIELLFSDTLPFNKYSLNVTLFLAVFGLVSGYCLLSLWRFQACPTFCQRFTAMFRVETFKRSFSDKLGIRSELTWVAVVTIIHVCILFMLIPYLMRNDFFVNENYAEAVLIGSNVLVYNIVILFVFIYYPIRMKREMNLSLNLNVDSTKKLRNKKQNKYNQKYVQTLKLIETMQIYDVLNNHKYFDCLVEHLAQEFNLENLLFLIEIWQFKYALLKNKELRSLKLRKLLKSHRSNILTQISHRM